MADQQKADTPPTEGQQARGSRASGRGTSSTDTAQSGSMSGSSGQGAQSADQERQRHVSREPETSGGTGLQRGRGRQAGAGASLARRGGQPSVLPALIANPELMASAFMSNPFAFAQAMSQEMDRLFDTFGGTSQGQGSRGLSTGNYGRGLQQRGGQQVGRGGQQMGMQDLSGLADWEPQIEVFQRENELVVRADLPGVAPDDVVIDIEDGMLTIAGDRQETRDDRDQGRYVSERIYGAFARTIPLPDGVDESQVRARFDNGVLEVAIPISEQQRQRGRRVPIQSGAGASSSLGAGQSASAQSAGSQTSGRQSAGSSASGSSGIGGQTTSGQSASGQSASGQSAGQQGGTHSGTGGSSSAM
jgi:HSP20 family protein